MSSTEWLTLVVGLLIVVVVVGLVGVWQFGVGLDQKGALASRNPRSELERAERRPIAILDRLVRRTNFGKMVQRRLTAAGLTMRPATFVLLLALAIAITVGVAWNYLAPLFALLAIGLIVWAGFRLLRYLEYRRREEFIGQLPELARVLSNSFAAGLALRTAIEVAAEELDDPAHTELRTTAESLRIGKPIEEALEDLGQRLPSRELNVLVSTLVISARAGGSMVTALRNISTTLEARKEIRREIKTVMSQAVSTSYVIVGMGVASLFVIDNFVEGGLVALTSSPVGVVLVAIAVTLFVVGITLIQRVTKVDI